MIDMFLTTTEVALPDVALVISSLTGLVAAGFAGWVALKQLPQVHKLVNSTATAQQAKIDALEGQITDLQSRAVMKAEQATAKAESKANPVTIQANVPEQQVDVPTGVELHHNRPD